MIVYHFMLFFPPLYLVTFSEKTMKDVLKHKCPQPPAQSPHRTPTPHCTVALLLCQLAEPEMGSESPGRRV